MKQKRAKELFVKGKTVTDIATALGLTRTTIYTYKSKDFEKGIDWDELRFENKTSSKSIKTDEKKFLNVLMQEFERAMLDISNTEDPKDRLNTLTKFVGSYWKIKSHGRIDCKGVKASGASEVVYALSKLAMEQSNHAVVKFLSGNHDIVIERVLSSIKG